MIKRYIPELQSLCAKRIASMCRSMSQIDRYNYLKSVPNHLKQLIKSFPVNIIEWYGTEMLLNIKIIRHYVDHKKDIHYLTDGYVRDCQRGITRHKVIWRKCQNVYCDESVLQKIIQSPDDIYWGLCKICERYRIQHHKLKKLHMLIEHFQF